jgi:predicted lipoprotein with Yx(FWY)xxD motif
MNRLLFAGVAAAAVLALAACGGGSDNDNSGAAPAQGSGTSAATVSAEDIGGEGAVLVDSSGKALYASDQEASGQVLCMGACTSFWTPLTVSAGAPSGDSLTGELGVVERPDGGRQVTYDGKPLYSFTEDGPGEVTGDGFSDAFAGQQFTWHVVHVDSTADSSGGGGNNGGFGY